jgi:hypothetical protein
MANIRALAASRLRARRFRTSSPSGYDLFMGSGWASYIGQDVEPRTWDACLRMLLSLGDDDVLRIIRNSPARAFADLHLIVSKALISARHA